jgi:hypothetical protein
MTVLITHAYAENMTVGLWDAISVKIEQEYLLIRSSKAMWNTTVSKLQLHNVRMKRSQTPVTTVLQILIK